MPEEQQMKLKMYSLIMIIMKSKWEDNTISILFSSLFLFLHAKDLRILTFAADVVTD